MINPGDGSKPARNNEEEEVEKKNKTKLQMEKDRNEKMLLQHLGASFLFLSFLSLLIRRNDYENQQWAAVADKTNKKELVSSRGK